MCKMSELSTVLDEMITCGEGMIKAANALKEVFSDAPVAETSTTPIKEEVEEAPVEVTTETETPEITVEQEVTYTAEAARGKLASISALGFSADIKDILAKYGADKFNNLKPEHYAAAIADSECLIHG